MSEETVCEHLSPALQTVATEPLILDKAEKTIPDIDKRCLGLPTAGLSSRSDFSPSENSVNPNSEERGQELLKVMKPPTEVSDSEHNDEALTEVNVSSSAIKMQMEDENRPHLKVLETRSQYHSIQQLSSPSTKCNNSVNCAPRISYKISDIVTPSRFYDETGKHSYSGSTCENMETATQSSEDEDESQKRARYSGKMLPNGQVTDYSWNAQEAQKPLYQGNQCEFSDEEEEFLHSSIQCGSDSVEDMSDMEMSDGGSRSHDESVGEVPQRKALPNIEESSQGPDVLDECVLTDVGFEGKMEAKRARVENIIKTMTPLHKGVLHSFPICRSFSAVSKLSENRDKEFSLSSAHDQAVELRRPKRKQYIPQQVDPRGEQHDLPPAVKVCVMERDAVRNELLKMQEGLNEMQLKYKQMVNCDHEVSFGYYDHDDSKENSGERSVKKALSQSDVNQNDVKSVSREFRQAFSNDWMIDMTNENTKDLGLNGTVTSLEKLTKILKTQITSGVEHLVDNILRTFLRKCCHGTSRDAAKNMEMMSPKESIPISSETEVLARHDLELKDELSKMESRTKGEGIGQTRRGDLSGTGSKVKDDISGSENHVQGDLLIATRPTKDNSYIAERKRKASMPLSFIAPSYHTASRSGADASSHLPTLPPPLTMQPPYPIHSSISDVGRPSLSCERNKAEKYREHNFDTHSRGAFGIPQSHLSLFGPHHPHLYYNPCIGKFPPAFAKEQEQLEPLPLIVGAPKKPKRTKVIDRVSPRAIRSLPPETATQSEDGSRQLLDSPGKSFHPAPCYHHAGPVHDAFPHPSLLPFSLAPSVDFHNPSFQQHSTLLQAMYSQNPSSISHRENPSSLSSPSRKTPPFSSSSNLAKSFPKCESDASMYDQIMSDSMMTVGSSHGFTSTLTPMHLRKAKLMFFYVRYPSSAILKVYFPDVKFNKNNTAQLVKWFSNFREFYYIQMEKYARQALAEGVKSAKDLVVMTDAELYRILVVHYNRNCQIEVPENFRYVVQATLREFYTSIVAEKDQEPSWKKAIYKVIARMDDPVPDCFKSQNWMERLADG